MMTLAADQETATNWLHLHYFGAILIPTFFLRFILSFLQFERKSQWLIRGCYALTVVFQILSLQGSLASATPKPPFNYYTAPGSFYNLYSAYFVLCVTYGFALLIKSMRTLDGHTRSQIHFLFVGTGIGFLGGSTAFLPVYNIPVFPFGTYLVAVYVFMVGYSILVYRFMDFSLLVRWGVAFGATSLVVVSTLFGITMVFENVNKRFFTLSSGIPSVIAASLAVFAFDPFRSRIKKIVDDIIFKSPDLKLQLDGVEAAVVGASSIEVLANELISKLKTTWNIQNAGVAVWNYGDSKYELLPKAEFLSCYVNRMKIEIDKRDFLVRTLTTERRLFDYGIVLEDELTVLGTRASAGERTTFWKIRRTMRWIKANACVPLMAKDELIGFIILGRRSNNLNFNIEDKKLLAHIGEMVSRELAPRLTLTLG